MKIRWLVCVLFLASCAGWERGCSSWNAESFGANWIVVQYAMDGSPMNCWKLSNVSITNEQSSDGVYWKDPSGHLIHISGWYNRVQVEGGDFDSAAKAVGIHLPACKGGTYRVEGKVEEGKVELGR
jgi:hypothetical protein